MHAYLSHTYTVTYVRNNGSTGGWGWITRSHAAEKIKEMRELVAEGVIRDYRFKHVSTYVETDVHMCYGCEARPALWDMDCDGPYATAECGQCSWWDAVNAREAQEDRCAMGEAKARDRAALADILSCVPGLF